MKKALITGITGQDGSYLAELLLSKGYEVHGIIRRASSFNTGRINHLYLDPHVNGVHLFLHYGDVCDTGSVERLLNKIKPDEIYHLGAQSHVRVSFDLPEYTANATALGTLRLLEAMRNCGLAAKFYNAASSEMFGAAPAPQNEETKFVPQSPYAISKVFSFNATQLYRRAYGFFACNGILFNHESPRRGETFVTKKITRGIARIKAGLDGKIFLGNLGAKRDWGFAPEYVEAMHAIMQQEKPDDFVVSTGQTHTIEEFLEKCFDYAGLGDFEKYIEFDQRYLRPTEVNELNGDCAKAKKQFGWESKIKFDDLCKIMVDADFRAIGLEAIGEGDKILAGKFKNKWWKND